MAAALAFEPIDTPRLRLRAIEIDDWPAIHRYMSDSAVTAWLPEGSLDAAACRAFAAEQAEAAATAVGVVERATGALVGHMPFHPWFQSHTQEVGWVFAGDRQGRGYATEAAAALLAFAFETLGCHRMVATCQPENVASWRVMEKLGMRREAHFRQALDRGAGVWWDEYFYALLADEYAAAR